MITDIRRITSRVLRGVGLVLLVASLLLPITLLQLAFDESNGSIWRYAKAANGSEVIFPDPNLETVIRKGIQKQDGAIYTSDLQQLTELNATDKGIADISGLEYCTNLKNVYLYENQITDISPLAELTNIRLLGLNGNRISDISPLSGLVDLSYLPLSNNQIIDISPLIGLTNLMTLGLSNNQIIDISPLLTNVGLPGYSLYLKGNPLNADSRNIYIPQLEEMGVIVSHDEMPYVVVTFLDPILEAAIRQKIGITSGDIYWPDLENIEFLSLGSRGITNLSGLEYCISVRELHIYMNQIQDISPLATLTKLTFLNSYENQIIDISPLAKLTNLRSIRLQDNQISDISALSGLTQLGSIYLSDNLIADISPLAELTNVQKLSLAGNKISDISSLSGLTDLYILQLNDNQIEDISPLVENEGFSGGVFTEHVVNLLGNPLNADSLNIYVHQLLGWGVTVVYDAVPKPISAGTPPPDTTVAPAPDTSVLPAPDTTVVPAPDTTVAPAPGATVAPATDTTATPLESSTDIVQPIIWVIIGIAGGVLVSFLFLKILRKP